MTEPMLSRRASLGLLLGGLAAGAARAADPAAGFAGVDAAAAQLVADRSAPGVAIAVRRAGRLLYARGFGAADLETGTPVAPRSIFKVGSITKHFTAAAILLLQQDGKLSIDDPLARVLPDFPRAREITLRQMLTHTSGLGNYTDTHPPQAFYEISRRDYDPAALYAMMKATDPLFLFEPGTDWAYSNTAYVLLGLVVEKVSGEPYGAFYQRRLFAPAGLTDTAVDDMAQVVPGRARGYTAHAGSDTQFDNASFISMTVPGGAGSIRSTAPDLCLWREALFAGRIVSLASLALMTTPARLKDGSLPLAQTAAGKPKAPIQYGFGLFMRTVDGRRCIEHGGGIQGFRSELRTYPDEALSVAILVNMDAAHPHTQADIEGLGKAADAAGLAAA